MNIIGCVDVWIDEIVPCLIDSNSGEIKETVVFKIESRSYLKRFRKDNGWNIDWAKLPNNIEIYALALKDTNEIQGIVGLKKDVDSKATFIQWACVAPHNNKLEHGVQKYLGIGAHLFAIAVDKSMQWGFEGVVHGFAINDKLLKHYIDVLGAQYLGMLHRYHFMIDENNGKKLLEVYHYEWNET